jgi:hypothetical protein
VSSLNSETSLQSTFGGAILIKGAPVTDRRTYRRTMDRRAYLHGDDDGIVETSQTPSKLDRLHQLSELLHPTGVSAGGGSEWGHAGKR